MEIYGLLGYGCRRIEIRAGGSVQVRVVGAPHQVTRANAAEIDGLVGESELQRAAQMRERMVDAPAFLFLLGAAPIGRVENHAVAGF